MADDNVIELSVLTRLDIPVEKILRKAGDADLESVIVVGWRKDGEFYVSSSEADAAEVGWALQRALWKLNRSCDELGDE